MHAIVVEVLVGLCVIAYGLAGLAALRVLRAALGTKRRIEELGQHRVLAALPQARADLVRLALAAREAQALATRGARAIVALRTTLRRTAALRIFR